MDWWKDKVSSFHDSMGWKVDEDDFDKKLQESLGYDEAAFNTFKKTGAYTSLKDAEKSRGLEKRQKLFDIAATGGAQDGGPAIPGGGTSGIGYAPQRDITKTFPGAMSKEEEEYLLALRGPVPGMMTYRGMS
tara:strand:- start:225 stop:620 length:396 start_codon:yes stop_codon:yes gene_type:complete